MNGAFEHLKLQFFGKSHDERIGVRIEGVTAGEIITLADVYDLLERRRATGDVWSTSRREDDVPVFSGLKRLADGKFEIEGAIEAYIDNNDANSREYEDMRAIPRPSHADYAVWAREGKIESGGGRFSGRMTAPLCVAGGICKEILASRGISINAYLTRVGEEQFLGAKDDEEIALTGLDEDRLSALKNSRLPVLVDENRAIRILKNCEAMGDSVGGEVECVVCGLKAGEAGDALFEGLEGKLAYAVFGVPAVKGVEFGAGFDAAKAFGSQVNDEMRILSGKVAHMSNNCGGICGGISNGMPIILRAAFKPTPSIARAQRSVDLEKMTNCTLKIEGRHDVCVAIRAVPAVEAAVAIALYDELKARGANI